MKTKLSSHNVKKTIKIGQNLSFIKIYPKKKKNIYTLEQETMVEDGYNVRRKKFSSEVYSSIN